MAPPMSQTPARSRSRSAARLAAVQALYQIAMTGAGVRVKSNESRPALLLKP